MIGQNYFENTKAGFLAENPIVPANTQTYETDTFGRKQGDGKTKYADLPYIGIKVPSPSDIGIGDENESLVDYLKAGVPVDPEMEAGPSPGIPAAGTSPTDYFFFSRVTDAVAAECDGVTSDAGTPGSTITVGDKTYIVTEDETADPEADEIDAGEDDADFAANIAAKITADTADTFCTAAADGTALTLTANDAGDAGNDIAISTDDPGLEFEEAFSGGADRDVSLQSITFEDLAAAILAEA